MFIDLELSLAEGEYCLDSRVLARRLGYKHETVLLSIKRHKTRLESKSILRQNVGKTTKDARGRGRPETYYQLNERQCLILAGSLKKGVEADEWHDALVDAFLQARQRVRQLETHQQTPPTVHTLTDRFRPRALENLKRVPAGYFSVMGELFKHLYNFEALMNQSLDEHAMIEISVGLRWSSYAHDELGIPDDERCKYDHLHQDNRLLRVWAYPIRYVDLFDKWLWMVYFPAEFAAYANYRAKSMALLLPYPKQPLQLKQPLMKQLTLIEP